jgi:hypothetical protein
MMQPTIRDAYLSGYKRAANDILIGLVMPLLVGIVGMLAGEMIGRLLWRKPGED